MSSYLAPRFCSPERQGGARGVFAARVRLLTAVQELGHPPQFYPGRDWEHVWRDQYCYDTGYQANLR